LVTQERFQANLVTQSRYSRLNDRITRRAGVRDVDVRRET
jgi:hypothetical protein